MTLSRCSTVVVASLALPKVAAVAANMKKATMRLINLSAAMAKRLAEATPWTNGLPLKPHRIAVVSSAGLVLRGESPFRSRDADCRVTPGATPTNRLLISHVSTNFHRTAFAADRNAVFPLDRLNEFAAEGVIGSVAAMHYPFIDAADPVQMEVSAREVAEHLKRDRVDTVLLSPV
jgi:D-proline reductase (dithiol) PrdB